MELNDSLAFDAAIIRNAAPSEIFDAVAGAGEARCEVLCRSNCLSYFFALDFFMKLGESRQSAFLDVFSDRRVQEKILSSRRSGGPDVLWYLITLARQHMLWPGRFFGGNIRKRLKEISGDGTMRTICGWPIYRHPYSVYKDRRIEEIDFVLARACICGNFAEQAVSLEDGGFEYLTRHGFGESLFFGRLLQHDVFSRLDEVGKYRLLSSFMKKSANEAELQVYVSFVKQLLWYGTPAEIGRVLECRPMQNVPEDADEAWWELEWILDEKMKDSEFILQKDIRRPARNELADIAYCLLFNDRFGRLYSWIRSDGSEFEKLIGGEGLIDFICQRAA